ncbi:hypothetical protein EPA93_24005 [Ktedonosporobacter rubrisoli]|uniref:Uncharacterized protein n=1 Tax=Ktedonosporobacter rubrisoli TaxID=2509675 RepID=A0A4P6JTI1_KTERU|nr:hypothetical protein [Ktedonosporobacter rubrisoli]QBD78878.1 hypothetical protein EPA93_24005 [Ktedonosporobacter rubrisoli]
MGSYQEPLMALEATPAELAACEEAIVVYIRLLEATIEPSLERSELIDMLHSFQKRYQGMHQAQVVTVKFLATSNELIALGSAILGYTHLISVEAAAKTKAGLAKYRTVSARLLSFQQRYVAELHRKK